MVTRLHLHSSLNHFIFSSYVLEKILKVEHFLKPVGIWHWASLIWVLQKKKLSFSFMTQNQNETDGRVRNAEVVDRFLSKRSGANITSPVDWSIFMLPNIESNDATGCLIIFFCADWKETVFPWAGWYLLSMEQMHTSNNYLLCLWIWWFSFITNIFTSNKIYFL